jgi:hypothetical protein
MKVPGSPAIATTTSLSAVNLTWAGGAPLLAKLIGYAPSGPSLGVHLRDPAGHALQSFAALLGCGHPTSLSWSFSA